MFQLINLNNAISYEKKYFSDTRNQIRALIIIINHHQIILMKHMRTHTV